MSAILLLILIEVARPWGERGLNGFLYMVLVCKIEQSKERCVDGDGFSRLGMDLEGCWMSLLLGVWMRTVASEGVEGKVENEGVVGWVGGVWVVGVWGCSWSWSGG